MVSAPNFIFLIEAIPLKLAEERASTRRAERSNRRVVALDDLRLRGCERQAAAGGGLKVSELCGRARLEGDLQRLERTTRSAVHIEHGDGACRQRAPIGGHDLRVHLEEHRRVILSAAQKRRYLRIPAAAHVVQVKVVPQPFGQLYRPPG